jgi:hypothetical protein
LIFLKNAATLVAPVMKIAGLHMVVDVGAGEGVFGEVASTLGYHNVISIDIRATGGNHVVPADSFRYQFNHRDILLFIRPCHGAFISTTLHNAGVTRCLYVGFAKNVTSRDLPSGWLVNATDSNWFGSEGERLYEFIKVGGFTPMFDTFYLVRDKTYETGNTFVRREGSKAVSLTGGWCSFDSYHIIRTFKCRERDLDHGLTYLHDPESDVGWLYPEGDFVGCPYGEHIMCALLVLGNSATILESGVWVHVTGTALGFGEYSFLHTNELTQAQRTWLIANEHTPGVLNVQKLGAVSGVK